MKFFNLLSKRKKKSPESVTELQPHYNTDEGELKVLHNCLKNRETFVERIAAWNINEIEERLCEYEEEATSLKRNNEVILFKIFEEKISQLKEARKRVLVNR